MKPRMKFWKKLVLFIITIIAIILSYSRYNIVKSNFLHSIENSSKQNSAQHILEKYMLESDIVKSIQARRKSNRRKNNRAFKIIIYLYGK